MNVPQYEMLGNKPETSCSILVYLSTTLLSFQRIYRHATLVSF